MNVLVLGFIAVFSLQLSAQQNPASAPVSAEEEILRAFQREYTFLAAQKESLVMQTARIRREQKAKLGQAEAEIQKLESQVAQSQAQNDRSFEEVQIYERRRKEDQSREATIKNIWKRMKKGINENRTALAFGTESAAEDIAPDEVGIYSLVSLSKDAIEVLKRSQNSEVLDSSYLNAQDELVEGKILRIGRVAAFSLRGESVGLLGPGGQSGKLKEVEQSSSSVFSGPVTPVYAFESVKEKLKLKKPAGWKEHAADFAPVLFLGVLFLMVGWLFTKLART